MAHGRTDGARFANATWETRTLTLLKQHRYSEGWGLRAVICDFYALIKVFFFNKLHHLRESFQKYSLLENTLSEICGVLGYLPNALTDLPSARRLRSVYHYVSVLLQNWDLWGEGTAQVVEHMLSTHEAPVQSLRTCSKRESVKNPN